MRTASVGRVSAASPCEVLEGRRLFAGFGPHAFLDYAGDNTAVHMPPRFFVPRPAGFGGGMGVEFVLVNLPADTAAATPAATVTTAALRVAVTSATPAAATTAVPVNTAAPQAARVPQAEAPAAVPDATPVTADPTPPAGTAVGTAVATSDTAAVAVRPSWAAAVTAGPAAAASTPSGLVNLLARPARTAAAAVAPAGNPAARATARTDVVDEPSLETAPAVAAPTEAGLLPVPTAAAGHRPVWQTLAAATAGAVLVSANWVVRRRNRRTALSVRRGA